MGIKVATVVGARPQFIKAAMVSNVLRRQHTEILIHTGQHYDYNMSGRFFQELGLPHPDYNLGISGGTHAKMTGAMMAAVEEVLVKEQPGCLLVYGDTNSTLAAALAAVKLHIPVCHVEAGCRSHSLASPEEVNRVCTDHISTLLLPCTKTACKELEREGLRAACGQAVGDPMYDAFLKYSHSIHKADVRLTCLDGGHCQLPDDFYYLTCHREENTGGDYVLLEVFRAMEQLDAPVVYPVHPRNQGRAMRLVGQYQFKNLIITEPVGYLESICMANCARKVVTDSGGLQREAFFAGKKCVTIMDHVVWPETMVDARNELAKPDAADILEKLSHTQRIEKTYQPFGDGNASEKIVEAIKAYIQNR